MVKRIVIIFLPLMLLSLMGCRKDKSLPATLTEYVKANDDRMLSRWLIACAAGMPEGWMGDAEHPVSVFFLPENNATEFRYFESDGVGIDITDFDQYHEIELEDEPVFGGKLWRFKRPAFSNERWGVVTYKTEGTLHVCEPIRLKVNTKPTQFASELITVTDNGVTPHFAWQDGTVAENVIYFQVIANLDDSFISGTYTYDLWWEFYNLANVVLNIHDVTPAPVLQPNQDYKFVLMGVSEDNWVNLMGEKVFTTQ